METVPRSIAVGTGIKTDTKTQKRVAALRAATRFWVFVLPRLATSIEK
ncbi:hypothetical protein H6F42_11660 [Pseudanabaena sp. FACHB-1998]|nr:hypothetical protein [Pseudanabaena sp. FACHB-1998]